MRTAVFACIVAALASRADGFVGSSMRPMTVRHANSLRMTSEVTVPGLIKKTRELKLLSTAANLGLLSKLEKAGLTLKDVEKLLPLVDENDLIGLAKGLGPDILNVAPAALSAAPAALPILATALSIPGEALFAAALASIAAGLAVVVVLPDNSMAGIALETFLAVPLLFVFPAVCGVGGLALSGLKNGWLIDTITSRSSPPSRPELAASVAAPVTILSKPAPPAAFTGKAKPAPKPKKDSGRPALAAMAPGPKVSAPKPAAPKAAPKKVAPKPAPKPKPMGNVKNLPKAL